MTTAIEQIVTTGHLYRVDRFVVPEAAREEFLARVHDTHEILRAQPGFVRDLLLEHPGAPGTLHVITLAEWAGKPAVEAATVVVGARHREMGFSAPETIARLGVQAEIGWYRRLDE